ncbi:MAG: PAS domain S-box protein [Bacteroidia bacterium]|nr:PAS domain S-box protein [Bacteroidia bacterium]
MFVTDSPLFLLALSGTLLLAVVVLLVYLSKMRRNRKEEDSFVTLFEQQPEAWIIMDGISLKAIKANQKAMNMFGIYREQFLTQLSFRSIFEEELSEDEAQLLVNAVDNQTFVNKLLNCRSLQGRVFKVNVSISRVYEGNLFCRFAEPLEMAMPMPHTDLPAATEEAPAEKDLPEEPRRDEFQAPRSQMPVRESSPLSSGLVKATADAVAVIGLHQEFLDVNSAFTTLTGYSEAELKSIGFDQLVHPSEARLHEEWMRQLLEGKYRISRTERKVLRKDGSTAQLEFLGAGLPARMAVVITAIDNSEARARQQLLLQNRENLLALVENTGEAVLSLDALGRITVINQHYISLFEASRGLRLEAGMVYENQLDAEARKAWKERFRNVLQGMTERYREALKNDRGEELVYEVLLYPVKDEHELITGVSFSGRDITERISQEEALKDARDKAEMATLAKSEFLAVMSHEIRTPLNGLIGISELLNSTELDDQQKEFVDIIRLSGEALLQVISDILDFSKIEARKMQMEYAPFRLKDAVEETLTILSGRAREKGLELKTELGSDVPAGIMGDKARLRQVLMNLVGNALKFTERGSVSVSVRKTREQHGEVDLEFSVKDTGVGLEAEQAEKLFTAFTQADPSTYRKYGGSGLGLTICKMLVDLMGGKIWVESRLGEGSTFFFTVKTRIARTPEAGEKDVKGPETKPAAASRYEEQGELARLHPADILLVEDNDINRLLASKLFDRLGYRIDTAANGKEAFNAVGKRKYDLVFMDVQMPEWDGLEATLHIRSEVADAHQPVIIAMTAFAGDDDKDLCRDAGMDDYISKPVILDDLERMIVKWSPAAPENRQESRKMKKYTDKVSTETPLINQSAIQRLMDIGKQTDPGFLQQVLEMFMKQAPENIEEIKQGLDRGDLTAMWKAAHKLKGTCLNIGAARLSEVCRDIERKGRNLEIAGLHGLCMQLENDYRATVTELKNLFQYN